MKKETIFGIQAWRAAQQPDSGMVLVAAMLLLALLSLLAAAGIGTSTIEVKIAGHDRDAKQAFYLCEAGLEKGKYKALNGWGKGQGLLVTSSPPSYSFEFDSATLPAAMKLGSGTVFTWGADKWKNFTLVDERGLEYAINANDSGGLHYTITDCVGQSTPPNDGAANGRVHLYFKSPGTAFSRTATITSGTQITVTGADPGWALDQWIGYFLRDTGTGAKYSITDSGSNTLTLSWVPAISPFEFEILTGYAFLNTFTIYDDQPNTTWFNTDSFGTAGMWFLVDKNHNFFPITGATVLSSTPPTHLRLQVVGSPADGAFRLVANPWLASTSAATPPVVTYTSGAGPTDDFVPPSGISIYGSVDVAVADSPTAGTYEMDATSTSGGGSGNKKTIRTDCRLDKSGNLLFNNWRQVK